MADDRFEWTNDLRLGSLAIEESGLNDRYELALNGRSIGFVEPLGGSWRVVHGMETIALRPDKETAQRCLVGFYNTRNAERIARLRKWVRALRSGKFTRTTGKLRRVRLGKERNCCIGVAGRIAELKVDDEGVRTYAAIAYYYGYLDSEERTLTNINDQSHGSFEKIANWIEKNLIGVGKEVK